MVVAVCDRGHQVLNGGDYDVGRGQPDVVLYQDPTAYSCRRGAEARVSQPQ